MMDAETRAALLRAADRSETVGTNMRGLSKSGKGTASALIAAKADEMLADAALLRALADQPDEREAVVAARRQVERYAAEMASELADARREISILRDVVVSYGDMRRMANASTSAMQQAIDRAFDREK